MAGLPPAGPERRYSGKVTAIIIVTVVVVFLVLNFAAERLIPRPDRPVPRPVVTTRTPVAG